MSVVERRNLASKRKRNIVDYGKLTGHELSPANLKLDSVLKSMQGLIDGVHTRKKYNRYEDALANISSSIINDSQAIRKSARDKAGVPLFSNANLLSDVIPSKGMQTAQNEFNTAFDNLYINKIQGVSVAPIAVLTNLLNLVLPELIPELEDLADDYYKVRKDSDGGKAIDDIISTVSNRDAVDRILRDIAGIGDFGKVLNKYMAHVAYQGDKMINSVKTLIDDGVSDALVESPEEAAACILDTANRNSLLTDDDMDHIIREYKRRGIYLDPIILEQDRKTTRVDKKKRFTHSMVGDTGRKKLGTTSERIDGRNRRQSPKRKTSMLDRRERGTSTRDRDDRAYYEDSRRGPVEERRYRRSKNIDRDSIYVDGEEVILDGRIDRDARRRTSRREPVLMDYKDKPEILLEKELDGIWDSRENGFVFPDIDRDGYAIRNSVWTGYVGEEADDYPDEWYDIIPELAEALEDMNSRSSRRGTAKRNTRGVTKKKPLVLV